MKTKEFNKENVLDVLSGLHDSMFQMATEYCDGEYNAGVHRSVKMLERCINIISDMPVYDFSHDVIKSFNSLLLTETVEHLEDSCDCYFQGVRDCVDIMKRLAGDSNDE